MSSSFVNQERMEDNEQYGWNISSSQGLPPRKTHSYSSSHLWSSSRRAVLEVL